ncbi:glycosyltransferase 87 family protein [Amycolatopsis rifamycinica]|uniref:glycosyltransferase 87 family protein n=1 Tax=Amycolatopsis rifamycinica TaxID=287986 RepID=UPI0005C252E1|nr:glycosyltransferase 87 family protein [Amycolatopsis rifamycinica]
MTGGGAAARARPGSSWVLLGAQPLVLVAVLVSYNGGRWRFPAYRVDLDVYRLGSTALLHGQALYGTLPPTGDGQFLLFTYPPFAAIVLTPLAVLPYWAACLALTLLTLGVLAVVLVTVLRAFGARCDRRRVAALLLAAEVLEPVLRTLYAGQLDLLLLALVVLDVLVDTPRWPRGLLIGLAAAVKLTPAVFLLYFLFRRDTRTVVTAAVTFLAATALGFLLAGAGSVRYWTSALWDTGRVGEPTYAGNQSLLGLLARAGVSPEARTAWWLPLVAVVLVLTAWGVRRALAAGELTVALGLNALGGLLVSPISWTHHWVWAVVVLLGWAELARRTRRRAFAVPAATGAVLFVAGPQWWWPRGGEVERHWAFVQQLTGNGYVLFGLAVLLTAVLVRFPRREDPLSGAVPARAGASPRPG